MLAPQARYDFHIFCYLFYSFRFFVMSLYDLKVLAVGAADGSLALLDLETSRTAAAKTKDAL